MSTRNFWKVQKDKNVGTPSTTPSASINETGSDSPNTFEVSTSSVRQSDDKPSAMLTAAAIDSVVLWKQPSKRRLFGALPTTAAQKRYFVITPNELAYKDKDNADSEFKVVWKIGSEVQSVEAPSEGSKDFTVVILENGAPRALRLSANDGPSALKFAAAVQNAIKTAAVPKSEISSQKTEPLTSGDQLSLEDSQVKTTVGGHDELPSVLSNANEVSMQTTAAELEDVSEIGETITTIETGVEAPIPISERSKEETKPSVWFWGMCCAAE